MPQNIKVSKEMRMISIILFLMSLGNFVKLLEEMYRLIILYAVGVIKRFI